MQPPRSPVSQLGKVFREAHHVCFLLSPGRWEGIADFSGFFTHRQPRSNGCNDLPWWLAQQQGVKEMSEHLLLVERPDKLGGRFTPPGTTFQHEGGFLPR